MSFLSLALLCVCHMSEGQRKPVDVGKDRDISNLSHVRYLRLWVMDVSASGVSRSQIREYLSSHGVDVDPEGMPPRNRSWGPGLEPRTQVVSEDLTLNCLEWGKKDCQAWIYLDESTWTGTHTEMLWNKYIDSKTPKRAAADFRKLLVEFCSDWRAAHSAHKAEYVRSGGASGH